MSGATENKVYVVTGANRNIGLGIVKTLLARPQHTVVATVRSEEAKTSLEDEARSVPKGTGSTLEIIKYDFSTAVPPEQVESTFAKLNIGHIDVLVLNTGGAQPLVHPSVTKAEDMRAAFELNSIAPLLVFQGLKSYLLQSKSTPKVISVTSAVGSIGDMDPFGGGGYGPSRAAQNWVARSIHLEFNGTKGDTRLICIALHPGWVQTETGQFAVDQWQSAFKAIDYKIEMPPTKLEDSISGIIKVIDDATAEHSGKFLTFEGKTLPW